MNIKQLNETLKTLLEWEEGEWSANGLIWWNTDENGKITVVRKYFSLYGNPRGCSITYYPEHNETKSECIKIINAYKKENGLPPYGCDDTIN